MDPNCKEKLDYGNYEIIVEGLDITDSYGINIAGITESLCEKVTEKEVIIETIGEVNSEIESSEINQQINQLAINQESRSNEITGNVIYESSDVKAKKQGIYIFSFILIIVLIYFIFKR